MATEENHTNRKETPARTLIDLIDRATLQALQDVFSDRHKVAIAILDRNAEPITFEHGHCDYCKEIRKSKAAYDHCRVCDRRIIERIMVSGQAEEARCDHGGLLDFAAPIRVDQDIIAFFFIGQIRDERSIESSGCLAKCLKTLQEIRHREKEKRVVSDSVLRREYARIAIRSAEEIQQLRHAATEFARDLSAALTKLVKWRKPEPVKDFVVKMGDAADFDQLLDLCVRQIPRLMGTRNCSVFTVAQGSRETEPRLVLRRTSFAPSRELEGKVSYGWGEGLTGWVWKNKRPLRLADLTDPLERNRYNGLEWADIADDSYHQREWLGIPLFGRRHGDRRDVIGVIRVPQKTRMRAAGKERPGGGFGFEEEILLMAIGQHVARRIEELQAKKRVETATRSCLQCAIDLTRATDKKDVGSILMEACERAFGTDGRVHFFNLRTDQGETLRIAAMGGRLSPANLVGKEVPLDESLSGSVIRLGRPAIVHDVKKAKSQKEFFPAIQGMQCAMSAPIQFAQQTYGALSVCADRPYEFSEEPDLHTLKDLASMAGSALARLDVHWQAEVPFAHFTRSTGHALHSRIATLESTIAALKLSGSKARDEITALENATEFLKAAANHALRYGRAWDRPEFQQIHIEEIVTRLKNLYHDRRLHWMVRPTPEVRADPWLIEQIIVELVVNALRFAPSKERSGRIVVRIYSGLTRLLLGKRSRAIFIQVQDNGPGVPRSEKQLIFQPYRTIDRSRLGLGLSIVMRAVQEHGGLVFERGRQGYGACFRVIVPVTK